jgi:ATP-dependent protease ClpP protease subunit
MSKAPARANGDAVAIGRRGFLVASLVTAACTPPRQPLPPEDRRGFVLFSAGIHSSSTDNLIRSVDQLTQEGINDISLILNTPGGDGPLGYKIYEHLGQIQKQGITVSSWNLKKVASMGCYIFLAANKRYSAADATFDFHSEGAWDMTTSPPTRIGLRQMEEKIKQVSAGDLVGSGATALMTDNLQELRRMRDGIRANAETLKHILAERTNTPTDKIDLYTESTEIVVVSAAEALRYGIVQDIAVPSAACGSTMLTITDDSVSKSKTPCIKLTGL